MSNILFRKIASVLIAAVLTCTPLSSFAGDTPLLDAHVAATYHYFAGMTVSVVDADGNTTFFDKGQARGTIDAHGNVVSINLFGTDKFEKTVAGLKAFLGTFGLTAENFKVLGGDNQATDGDVLLQKALDWMNGGGINRSVSFNMAAQGGFTVTVAENGQSINSFAYDADAKGVVMTAEWHYEQGLLKAVSQLTVSSLTKEQYDKLAANLKAGYAEKDGIWVKKSWTVTMIDSLGRASGTWELAAGQPYTTNAALGYQLSQNIYSLENVNQLQTTKDFITGNRTECFGGKARFVYNAAGAIVSQYNYKTNGSIDNILSRTGSDGWTVTQYVNGRPAMTASGATAVWDAATNQYLITSIGGQPVAPSTSLNSVTGLLTQLYNDILAGKVNAPAWASITLYKDQLQNMSAALLCKIMGWNPDALVNPDMSAEVFLANLDAQQRKAIGTLPDGTPMTDEQWTAFKASLKNGTALDRTKFGKKADGTAMSDTEWAAFVAKFNMTELKAKFTQAETDYRAQLAKLGYTVDANGKWHSSTPITQLSEAAELLKDVLDNSNGYGPCMTLNYAAPRVSQNLLTQLGIPGQVNAWVNSVQVYHCNAMVKSLNFEASTYDPSVKFEGAVYQKMIQNALAQPDGLQQMLAFLKAYGGDKYKNPDISKWSAEDWRTALSDMGAALDKACGDDGHVAGSTLSAVQSWVKKIFGVNMNVSFSYDGKGAANQRDALRLALAPIKDFCTRLSDNVQMSISLGTVITTSKPGDISGALSNHDPVVYGEFTGKYYTDPNTGKVYAIIKAKQVDVLDGSGLQDAGGESIYVEVDPSMKDMKEGDSVMFMGDVKANASDGTKTMAINTSYGGGVLKGADADAAVASKEAYAAKIQSQQWYQDNKAANAAQFGGGLVTWKTGWDILSGKKPPLQQQEGTVPLNF